MCTTDIKENKKLYFFFAFWQKPRKLNVQKWVNIYVREQKTEQIRISINLLLYQIKILRKHPKIKAKDTITNLKPVQQMKDNSCKSKRQQKQANYFEINNVWTTLN